jgi:hypothetical protein
MAAEDAFCAECGTHVVGQALIPGDEATQPGGAPPRRSRASSSAPETNAAYDRPYERLDDLQPARPIEREASELLVGADGEPDPIRTFDGPMALETDNGDEYADYPESTGQRFSPVMLGLAAVFIAIIIAGIIVAFAGGSDDGGGSTSNGNGGQLAGIPLSAGGFGSMSPDGTLSCAKGTAAAPGARTAVAGAVEVLAAPATWSSRDVVKGRVPGTGAGSELTLNPADHDRAAPQSARIYVLTVDPNVATFPDQFLVSALASGNATTVKQDCLDYGPYTALRVQRVELASGGTLSTRYVVLYDKVRRGSAVMFVLEDPRNSSADAAFFDSMVASAKLLK